MTSPTEPTLSASAPQVDRQASAYPICAPRANVMGVGVSAINMDTAEKFIDDALRSGIQSFICVTGAHGVIEAQRDTRFRAVLNSSFLTTPDGMPTVWVGRLQGHREMRRVFGPELMLRICRLSEQRGYTSFLYGGAPGIAEELREALQARFPRLRVVGTYTPPFRPLTSDEAAELARRFEDLRPDITWVGLSTPKQERFMAEFSGRLKTQLMVGVGAAFDYHTGKVVDAPDWVKACGLQWLHRLAQDPRRLWRRYAEIVPMFAFLAVAQMFRLRRYPVDWQE